MTLLKIFNQQLERLPTISNRILESISRKEWPEEKKDQAIIIVEQIQ